MRATLGWFLVIMVLLNISACVNTQSTHFYLLRAMDPVDHSLSLEHKNEGISMGLGPVSLPKYLDRPQIVTRISSHEIDLAEFHNWAAPLKENVSQVLEENLSYLLDTQRIVAYPWNRSKSPTYQLSLDIMQLDGTKNQEAVLKVRWTFAKEEGKKILHQKTSQYIEVPRGPSYEDLVEAMSRILASFSQEIAEALNSGLPTNSLK